MSDSFDLATMDPEATELVGFLDRVLERVESVYQSYNVPLPNRRYWTIGSGQAPWDCDQVVVMLQTLNLGVPGDQSVATAQNCNSPTTATISISVVRPAATSGKSGAPPSPEKIHDHAIAPAVDAWVLHRSLESLDQYEDGSPGRGVIASTRMLQAQGGYHGVEILISVVVS